MCKKRIKKRVSILKINQQVKWLFAILILCVVVITLFKTEPEGLEIHSNIQKESCRLCSDLKDDILNIYQETDGIGIIHLSAWEVIDLEIDANITEEQGYTKVSMNTIEGSGTYNMITTPARRLCEIEIGLNRINQVSIDKMADFLCADCMREIVQENIYEFAFIDFQTKEVIPIKDRVKSFFINDYYICYEWGESEVKILAVYAPFKTD